MKTNHKFNVGQFVRVTKGAFSGYVAEIKSQTVSTITGTDFPAYAIIIDGGTVTEKNTGVREDWLSDLNALPVA